MAKFYKGFNKDLKCRGYQFEVGKEYTAEGEIEACINGFHACENPMDVLGYYSPNKFNRFCEVEGSGKQDKEDKKTCFEKIKIVDEIGLGGLIQAGIKFCFDRVKWSNKISTTGDYSGASTTGDYSGASSSGDYSGAYTTGDRSGATATGDCSGASTTGKYSGASTTGDYSGASTTGDRSGATATGDCSGASTTGKYSGASTTGDYSGASTTGDRSGATATGSFSGASATGNCSGASATGFKSKAYAGKGSVALAVGRGSRAKGDKGSWIVLTECHHDKEKKADFIDSVKVAKVDGEKIKADTWYTLKDGKFVEADEKY